MKLCMGCMQQMEEHLTVCPYCGFNEAALQQESYYLDPGTIIGGKYIVGKVMSYGGYTVSYLGMDAESNRRVMVKEYLPSDFSTRSEGEREVTIYSGDAREQFVQGLTNFLNEANRIQHLAEVEGIARVYDCVAENDTGYVISEYVEGKTLREILQSGRKYSGEEARCFISQILAGLSRVHPLDVIHCDISPDSIMVANDGAIKLLDFGATRYVTTANSKSLAIILKQGYAPEEQYRSQGVRGPWTDVYALGAVMYRMITGITPQESVERALVDDLKEPSKLGVKIPENIENALMNALNVYQKDRTPSAEAFLKELNSPEVKRRKVKRRKNETGKFPLWTKILVAVLLCAVIAGGIVLHKMAAKDVGTVKSVSEKMIDLSGKKWEEAEQFAKKINQKHPGWNIQVIQTGSVFDADPSKNGTIAMQNIAVDTDFNKLEIGGQGSSLVRDQHGNVSANIRCKVFSNETVCYGEISDIANNAYVLAEKLIPNFNASDTNYFHPVEKKNANYYGLAYVETADGTKISQKEIQETVNAEQSIAVNGLKIHYYASDFFYWDKLDNFEGKNLSELGSFPMYRKVNEKDPPKKEKEGRLDASSSLVDNSYYTFGDYGSGYIWKQTVAAGNKLDGSKQTSPFLLVVGQQVAYRGKTGAEVEQNVKWVNTKVSFDGDKDQEVVSVVVTDRENGAEKKFFKKDEKIKILIKTKAKETPNTELRRPEKDSSSNSSPITPKNMPTKAPAPAETHRVNT